MRSLKSLCLENWDSRLPTREANTKSQDVFSLADVISPSPSLKQLSLIRIGVVDPAPLDWLLKLRNGYDYTSLELSLDDMFRSSRGPLTGLRPRLLSIKPYITKLRLVKYRTGDDILSVIDLFSALKSLSLCCCWGESFSNDPLVLPSSIRSFQIHYSEPPFRSNEDHCYLALIKAHPTIRETVITYSTTRSGDNTTIPSHLNNRDTIEYCSQHDVEYKIKYVNFVSSFLDF